MDSKLNIHIMLPIFTGQYYDTMKIQCTFHLSVIFLKQLPIEVHAFIAFAFDSSVANSEVCVCVCH